jgi:DNA repair protein RecO (recombination protein O)
MSRLYKTEGIIIKRKNFGEADRIITIMTRDFGKLRVLAKGVRKITSRRSGHLEVFGHATFNLYQGKTFDSVSEVTTIESYIFPRDQLSKVSFAYYICELIDVLILDKQEQSEAYDLLESAFYTISQAESDQACDECVSDFALNLLKILGFIPFDKSIPKGNIQQYVESITERTLKTPKFIQKVG